MKPTTETRHPRTWPVGARVRLNVRPDRRECWPWILPPDGALATVAIGPDGDRDVTWVPVGPTGEIFVRFDGEHDTNDGLPVRICASDLTLLTETMSFHLVPEVDNGFGSWFHGTAVRRWQSTETQATQIARRFARLYRTRVKLYATPIDEAGVVRCVPRREVLVHDDDEPELARPEPADPDPDPSCRTCGDHGFQSHDCPDCGK